MKLSKLKLEVHDRERIFQRFEQAISAKNISGFGLALYISRQIVEQQGGRIWAEADC